MLNETTYELSPEGFIEIHYATEVTPDNQSKVLSALRSLITQDNKFNCGVELIVDMSATQSYTEEAQKITEEFVRDVNILRTATYGASDAMKAVREKFYTSAGKGDLTHYFPTRKEALAWIFAERAVNDIRPITEVSNKLTDSRVYWSTLIVTDPRYVELIYAPDIDLENQNRLMNDLENYAESVKSNETGGLNVLIDMSKTQTYTDGAQLRTKSTLQAIKLKKVAVFGATEVMKIIRAELYNTCEYGGGMCYFSTRESALKWLLSEEQNATCH